MIGGRASFPQGLGRFPAERLKNKVDEQSHLDGRQPVKIVSSLPVLPDDDFPEGTVVMNTGDGNFYRNFQGAWTATAPDSLRLGGTPADEINQDIADALNSASTAQATADGKVTTFFQDEPPTAEGDGDLWVDTNDGNNLWRWDAGLGSWLDIQDEAIQDALNDAANAQATADGKIESFFQDTPPTAKALGDLWYDTNDGNHPYRWSGSAWVSLRDGAIAAAQQTADQAQATADGKIETFFQSSPPSASGVGDLWFDTDDGNTAHRWNGSAWTLARDSDIDSALLDAADAQATADGKITTFWQDNPPTAEGVGDLWVDTNDDNHVRRWDGSSWVSVRDGTIQTAQDTANQALADAATLDSISGGKLTTGLIEETSGTSGIRIDPDDPLPAGWTTFMDLTADTTGEFLLKHPSFLLEGDGNLTLLGEIKSDGLVFVNDEVLFTSALSLGQPRTSINEARVQVKTDEALVRMAVHDGEGLHWILSTDRVGEIRSGPKFRREDTDDFTPVAGTRLTNTDPAGEAGDVPDGSFWIDTATASIWVRQADGSYLQLIAGDGPIDAETLDGLDSTAFLQTDTIVSVDSVDFLDRESADFNTDGRLYWDLSEGLYIKSSNALHTDPALLWSSANVTAGKNISVSFSPSNRPTLSVTEPLVLGSDPGGSEILRVGGSAVVNGHSRVADDYVVKNIGDEPGGGSGQTSFLGIINLTTPDQTAKAVHGFLSGQRSSFSLGARFEIHAETGWDGNSASNAISDSSMSVVLQGSNAGGPVFRLVSYTFGGDTWLGFQKSGAGKAFNRGAVFYGWLTVGSSLNYGEVDSLVVWHDENEVTNVVDYPGSNQAQVSTHLDISQVLYPDVQKFILGSPSGDAKVQNVIHHGTSGPTSVGVEGTLHTVDV